jgi:hypothetical protein
VLVALGLVAYVASGGASITALIPTFFGLPLAILGFVGKAENRRKHAMHAAAALAVLGFLGSARGVPATMTLATGGEVARPAAAVVQTVMALVCLVFVVLAVRSFVAARRARDA